MPRGGHFGLWKPTPKDIFRSRWKRFYKRCHRVRQTRGNRPDRVGPHEQPRFNPDGVPEPWRLLYSLDNFGGRLPPDTRPFRQKALKDNLERFLEPVRHCRKGVERDAVLRVLDRSRHGTAADSGIGRLETAPWPDKGNEHPEHLPSHIFNFISSLEEKAQPAQTSASASTRPSGSAQQRPNQRRQRETEYNSDDEQDQAEKSAKASEERQNELDTPDEDVDQDTEPGGDTATFFECLMGSKNVGYRTHGGFPVRRLQELIEEGELVWEGGLAKPDERQEELKERGRFPFIDEQASLIDELALKDILRLRHRTNSRRHPKWREIQYEYKKGHKSYLRRRQMLEDEAKARMGVIRQVLADS